MPIAFVEVMRGTLREPGGTSRLVDFHVRATGGAGGRFELSGVVHAPPWADETVASGTLAISLVEPSIAYDLRFLAKDGRRLRIHGAKRPSLLRPVSSMAALPVTLADDVGRALAEGMLRFDWLSLPHFLVSLLPMTTKPHRQLSARRVSVARRELG